MKKYLFVVIMAVCFLTGCSKGNETGENITGLSNGYFFPKDTASCTYDGVTFFELSGQSGEIVLSVTKVQFFEEGDLYELVIESGENAKDRFGIDRSCLGFFFVQGDEIYLIDSETAKSETLTKDEIISHGKLVCSKTGKEDTLEEDETGWHECIIADGNIREYHSYDNMTETGYYESFIWEYGNGLIGYRSGYGAEADAVSLTLSK